MKTVLILGATSGLAQALARRFARAGHRLILAARDIEKTRLLAKDIEIRANVETFAIPFDALATDTHQTFYQQLPFQPDVAVCVVGYLGEQTKAEKDFAEAERIINTNYTGVVSVLEVIAADFERRAEGVIIGVGSVAGDRGRQSNYVYGSAKAGLAAYLSGLRNRLHHAGVHVMTVKPGFMRTRMTEGMPLPAILTASPEQASEAIFKAFLRKRNVVYTLRIWRWIMLLIRMIPERLFKRLNM